MLAVVEAIRLAFPALLAAVRIGRALHLRYGLGRSAAFTVFMVIFPVKRLLAEHLPVQVYLLVQLFQIGLGGLFHCYQFLLVLVRFRLDVGRIRVQDRTAHQALGNALPKNFVEYLLWYVVVPETPPPVLADRRRVRRFLRQLQPAKPLIRDVVVDFLFQPSLRLYSIQIPHQQHPKQYLRIDGWSPVVCAIQRCAQVVDKAEINDPVHLPK